MNRKFISKSNSVLHNVIKENKNEGVLILKDFIESILKINIRKIVLNPYLNKLNRNLPSEDNFGIADCRIETEDNEEMNIGIQIIDGDYIPTKMLLYIAQIHTNQLEYDENRKVVGSITINILDLSFINKNEYHREFHLNSEDLFIKNALGIHTIELPNFNKRELVSREEEWISYLKGENIEYVINKNENIKKLDKLLERYWHKEVIE